MYAGQEEYVEPEQFSKRTPKVIRIGRESLRRYTSNIIQDVDVPCTFYKHANAKTGELWEIATNTAHHGHQRRWRQFNRLYEKGMLDAVLLQDGNMIFISH
jgi:hypothetical protein